MRFPRLLLLVSALSLVAVAGCYFGSSQVSAEDDATDLRPATEKPATEKPATEKPAIDAQAESPRPASAQDSGPTSGPGANDADAGEQPRVPVEVFRVEPRRVEEEILATGELRANEQVALRTETDGRIVALHFREGQRVRRGDLLVKVDDANLQAELARVRVQKELAERREQRSRALLDEKTISQALYDEASSELRVLAAEVDQLQVRIRKTEVRAPFSGVVGLREISEGSYVTPAQEIASLQSLDPIKIDFSVPEKYAGEIADGDRLTFGVAGNERQVEGTVYAVEPRIDVETRTVQVRARAPNADESLLPGAFARVRLVTERTEDALLVPAIALVPGAEATTVFVVDDDGRAQPRSVRLGQRTERMVHIVDGLSAGQRVITSGVQQVRAGTVVDVRRETSADQDDQRADDVERPASRPPGGPR